MTPRLLPTTFALLVALASSGSAQDEADFQRLGVWIQPHPGSMVLAGGDEPPDCVLDVFVHLAGGRTATLGVLGGKARRGIGARLGKRGARDVGPVSSLPDAAQARAEALTRWFELDGIWLAEGARPGADPSTDALVLEVMRRGGVVGLCGSVAKAWLSMDRAREQPFLPFVTLQPGSRREAPVSGAVQFAVGAKAALILHAGRRVCGYGEGPVVASVAGTETGWQPLRDELEVIDVFDPGDEPSYALDLLAWMRAAQDRLGPLFPDPESASRPLLRKGTLILQGGAGVQDETWDAFVEAAGGTDARIVCIPSAKGFDPGEEISSYSARELRERGCRNVRVLHAPSAAAAHADAVLHSLLEKADGVWIDGGRTFRFMDHYGGTTVAALLDMVLRRGGVVGGSSAGCQVPGELLVRGDPRSNRVLLMPGYTRGLGLLPGVVLDAHFLQRERDEPFRELVAEHPQLLGIGVDENTALVVEGSTARVLGDHQVSFFDLREGPASEAVRLERGGRYDLKSRRALRGR